MSEDPPRKDGESTGGGLPSPVVEDLLADDQRRQLLSYLEAQSEPVVVEDLAEHVATQESGDERDETRGAVDDARREIYDEHLPKLTATEVVDYDSMVGTVEPSTQWSSISDRLDDE